MKNVKIKTALTAVTLAAAALATSLPAYAAGEYQRNCNDTTNGLAGGVIGGSVGAAIGESIAGRGDRTEGAILGAIIGGIAGAAVGDGASDCEKDNRYDTRRVVTNTNHYPTRTRNYPTRTTTTHRGYQTVGHPSNNGRRRGHSNRHYGSDRGYTTTSYGYNADPLFRINREIEQTRREGDRLKRELKYSNGHRRGLRRALEANGRQLDYLKKERRRIKKYSDQRRNDYRPQTRNGHYHGTSRNLCYSDH